MTRLLATHPLVTPPRNETRTQFLAELEFELGQVKDGQEDPWPLLFGRRDPRYAFTEPERPFDAS